MHFERELQSYSEKRDRIVSLLESIEQVARAADLARVAAATALSRERVLTDEFRVAVIGEFSSGKSTFINALLGRPLLPVAARVCTAVPTVIRAATDEESERTSIELADGTHREVEPQDLTQLLTFGTLTQERPDPPVRAEVRLKGTSWLHQGVHLVDTPGVNDAGLRGERVTLEFLPTADAVVFLTRADQVFKASEVRFLQERVIDTDRQRLLFVVNAVDVVEPEDLAEIRERADSVVASLSATQRPHFVSAANGIRAREAGDEESWQESGMASLMLALNTFLVGVQGKAKLESGVRMVTHYSRAVEHALRQRLHAAQLTHDARAVRTRLLERRLAAFSAYTTHLARAADQEFLRLQESTKSAANPRIAELRVALRRLSGPKASVATRAGQLVEDVLGRIAVEVQAHVRSQLPSLHHNLARQVQASFAQLEASFDDAVHECMSFKDVAWSDLVEFVRTPTRHRPRREASVRTGVGAALGGLALAAFGGVPAIVGAAVGALAASLPQNRTSQDPLARVRQAAHLKKNKRASAPGPEPEQRTVDMTALVDAVSTEVEAAARVLVDGLRSRCQAELEEVLRAKEQDMREELLIVSASSHGPETLHRLQEDERLLQQLHSLADHPAIDQP